MKWIATAAARFSTFFEKAFVSRVNHRRGHADGQVLEQSRRVEPLIRPPAGKYHRAPRPGCPGSHLACARLAFISAEA
jgi:hypothetical protein